MHPAPTLTPPLRRQLELQVCAEVPRVPTMGRVSLFLLGKPCTHSATGRSVHAPEALLDGPVAQQRQPQVLARLHRHLVPRQVDARSSSLERGEAGPTRNVTTQMRGDASLARQFDMCTPRTHFVSNTLFGCHWAFSARQAHRSPPYPVSRQARTLTHRTGPLPLLPSRRSPALLIATVPIHKPSYALPTGAPPLRTAPRPRRAPPGCALA